MHRLPLAVVALTLGCVREHENLVDVIAEQAPGLKRAALPKVQTGVYRGPTGRGVALDCPLAGHDGGLGGNR